MVKRKLEGEKGGVSLQLRPPVVAVLGHVDHGKSTLLDFIRKSNITAKEHGGITQHIGAYQVVAGLVPAKRKEAPARGATATSLEITFIDTPGHEAFAKLRARGARVADIALLVIDASSSVKPQTKESIKYIKQASIPFIVAINKIDLPTANIKKVKDDLFKAGVVVEEKGGKIACLPISAKTGEGVKDLLETILLLSELKKISGELDGKPEGAVIEAKLDSRRGKTATILVKNGRLKIGDEIVIDGEKTKIRALFDESRKSVKEAGPSKPVEVLGFKKLPAVGSIIQRVENREQKTASRRQRTEILAHRLLDAVVCPLSSVLRVVLKADTQGSLEAILDGLSYDIEVVSSGVGDICENDVSFAKTAEAAVIGFNVKVSSSISKLAADEKVRIKNYQVIYKLFEEVEDVVKILKHGPQKEVLGKGRIAQEFLVKKQKIAGIHVFEGRLAKGDQARVTRGNQEITTNRIKCLRQEREEINKAEKGQECGLKFAGEVDFKVGDVVESFQIKKQN